MNLLIILITFLLILLTYSLLNFIKERKRISTFLLKFPSAPRHPLLGNIIHFLGKNPSGECFADLKFYLKEKYFPMIQKCLRQFYHFINTMVKTLHSGSSSIHMVSQLLMLRTWKQFLHAN